KKSATNSEPVNIVISGISADQAKGIKITASSFSGKPADFIKRISGTHNEWMLANCYIKSIRIFLNENISDSLNVNIAIGSNNYFYDNRHVKQSLEKCSSDSEHGGNYCFIV